MKHLSLFFTLALLGTVSGCGLDQNHCTTSQDCPTPQVCGTDHRCQARPDPGPDELTPDAAAASDTGPRTPDVGSPADQAMFSPDAPLVSLDGAVADLAVLADLLTPDLLAPDLSAPDLAAPDLPADLPAS